MLLLTEERLVHLGRVAERAGRGLVDLAEALRTACPEGPAELVEQDLEVRADVPLERREDLVDLDRDRGLADGERVAVLRLWSAGRARLEIDEQVALKEEPRAQLHRRVLVEWQRRLLQLHGHDRRGRRHALRLGVVRCPGLRRDLVRRRSDWMCSISVTLPTFTPAIRTGEAGRMFAADGNTASTVYGFAHGTLFVKA